MSPTDPYALERKLYNIDRELMEVLSVNVERVGEWTDDDLVTKNDTEFVAKLPERPLPQDAFKAVIESLSKPRQYEVCVVVFYNSSMISSLISCFFLKLGLEKDAAFIYFSGRIAEDNFTYFIPESSQEAEAQKVSSFAEFEYFARTRTYAEEEEKSGPIPDARRPMVTMTFLFPGFKNLVKAGLLKFNLQVLD